jgi:hypothetical protein
MNSAVTAAQRTRQTPTRAKAIPMLTKHISTLERSGCR